MEQMFQVVPKDIAVLRVRMASETTECANIPCHKQCSTITGILWRYAADDAFHYRLLCSWACALEAMPVGLMNAC